MYLLIALFSILVSTTLVFLLTRIAFKKRQSTFVEKPLTIFEMAATAGSQRFKQTMFMEHVSKGILKPVNVQIKNTKTNQLRWILHGSQGLAFSQRRNKDVSTPLFGWCCIPEKSMVIFANE